MEAVELTLPPYDSLSDMHGYTDGVPMSFAGNQWFLVNKIIDILLRNGIRAYVETIPPGIVRQRALGASLRVGTLTFSARPQVVSLPPALLDGLQVEERYDYVEDTIVLAYREARPSVSSWCDIKEIPRLAIPNPITEGIGAQVRDVMQGSCGSYEYLASRSFITRVHHREIPPMLYGNAVDAGVMWISEAKYWGFNYVVPQPELRGRLAFALLAGAGEGAREAYRVLVSSGDELKAAYEAYGFKWIGS